MEGKIVERPLVLCVLPPSWGVLRERLEGRKTEGADVIKKRM